MKRKSFSERILDFDISTILISLFLFVLGVYALFTMKVALLPPYSEPVLTIITDYHEMEPDIIEEIITRPIENLLKEEKGIKNFFSYSSKGRSKIVIFLNERENVDEKAVLIKDKIEHISVQFPEEVREPALYKYNTDDSPVMIISLNPRGRPGEDFDAFVEQVLKPEILSVEGVANVETAGARREEIFIEQRYEDLARLKGDYESLFGEIVRNNVQVPVGEIESGSERITLSFPNRYGDFLLIPRYRLLMNNIPVRGSDVLSVRKEKRQEERLSLVDNAPALTLYVFKKDLSDILDIERGVRELLAERRAVFSYSALYDQAQAFRLLLRQLGIAAALSLLCVFFTVLILYKRPFFALLTVLDVSLGLTGTASFLLLLGRSLNIMTLSGIILGMGPCAVNGLILFDEIRDRGPGRAIDGALSASIEKVFRPTVTTTLTLIVVFIPLFSMSRELTSLYADFALAVSLMLVTSSAVSLLFAPAFIKKFDGGRLTASKRGEGGRTIWRRLLVVPRMAFSRSPLVLFPFAALAAACGFLFFTREYEEVSPLREADFELYFEFDPEFNAEYKRGALLSIGGELLEMGMPITLVSKLEDTRVTFFIKFPPGYRHYQRDVDRLRDRLAKLHRDDGFFTFQTGRETGVNSILIYFFGDRLEQLEEVVDKAAEYCSGLTGVTQVLKGYRKGKTELTFTVDPSRMYSMSLNASEVIRFLRYVFYFPVLLKHYDGEKIVDVRGRVAVGGLTKESIRALRVPSAKGEYVALSEFTTLSYSKGSPVITRKNGKRFISLDLRYENIGEDTLVQSIQRRLEGMELNGDEFYEFDEKLLEARRSRGLFLFALALASFLVYVVLGTAMKSFTCPLMVILTVPSFFAGSLVYLAAGGFGRSVPVHIALIMLTGLSVNGPLILIEETVRLRTRRKSANPRALLLRTYERKFRIIAAVAVSTVVSLIPVFVLSHSTIFFEILAGLMLSGTLSSLFISLLVFPAVYALFAKGEKSRRERGNAQERP